MPALPLPASLPPLPLQCGDAVCALLYVITGALNCILFGAC